MTSRACRPAVLACAVLAALPGAALGTARPYAARSAAYRAQPVFQVSYRGAGRWRTDFHATPPNPGGAPDVNDAHDSSEYAWSLAYAGTLAAAAAATPPLSEARGRTLVVGHVDHAHDDGLYTELDRTVRCTLKDSTAAVRLVPATLDVRYDATRRAYAFSAGDPLSTVMAEMPTACPQQGDSIDRILDQYFTPGFSFDPSGGPDRWLRSGAVTVPARVLRRSRSVTIALRDTRAGRPPRDCGVPNPAFEHCAIAGRWAGTLVLRRAGR
ncbi:MAG: hypothetical protein ACJ760_03370 [Thermoleophilaceae bacterium]